MKTLCLIRHAKSSWSHPSVDDIERPLDDKGIHNAELMGGFIAKRKVKPDVIIASPAKRTQDTAELLAKGMKLPNKVVEVNKDVYEAGVEDLLDVIQNFDDKHQTVVLVGHNPGLTWLANYLADDHMINLPTCGTYCVQFETDKWSEITTADSKMLFMDCPKNHDECMT